MAAMMALSACRTSGTDAPPDRPAGSGQSGPFGWREEIDAATGWRVVSLSYRHPSDPHRRSSARFCPDAGANLFSFNAAGVELLHHPDDLKALGEGSAGTPILYPSPNRMRASRFTFEGRTFVFGGPEKNFIHGLVRRASWRSDLPVLRDTCPESPAGCVEATCRIDFLPGTPLYEKFPIDHRLSVRYCLTENGLRIAFTVENRDTARLPFGFAIHPYFRVPGAREKTFLWVPAEARMEASADLLPTGTLQTLDGAPFDLRRRRLLSDLSLDDVFWGLRTSRPAGFESADAHIRLDLPASEEFTHMVVYTPPDKPYFCMENQTCSTDAHNLHEKGLVKVSHLLVVEPGQSKSGWVDFRPR